LEPNAAAGPANHPGGGSARATDPFAPVLPIKTSGDRNDQPLWFIHSGGGLCWPYLGFAGRLPADRPIYGIQAKGFDGTTRLPESIDEIIADYVAEILAVQPAGPFHLIGYSIGGTLAHAIAAALQRQGHEVALLALLDSVPSDFLTRGAPPSAVDFREYFRQQLTSVAGADDFESLLSNAVRVVINQTTLMSGFASPVYRGDALLFRATLDPEAPGADLWRPYVSGAMHRYDVASTHADLHMPEPAAEICQIITRTILSLPEGVRR